MLDNTLFALVIDLIQNGMNNILAANYDLLATQSGNVITTEGGSGIEADTVVVPVLQAYQPTMQGSTLRRRSTSTRLVISASAFRGNIQSGSRLTRSWQLKAIRA